MDRRLVVESERVVDMLGHWPSLHDTEIDFVAFEKTGSDPSNNPNLRLVLNIREYETVDEGKAIYHQRLRQAAKLSLLFVGIRDSKFGGFNFQNVIDDITLVENAGSGLLLVTVESIFGFYGYFSCERVETGEIEIYDQLK